jgi:hypothetical protein
LLFIDYLSEGLRRVRKHGCWGWGPAFQTPDLLRRVWVKWSPTRWFHGATSPCFSQAAQISVTTLSCFFQSGISLGIEQSVVICCKIIHRRKNFITVQVIAFAARETQSWILSLPLNTCMTLNKLPNFSDHLSSRRD